MVHELFKTSVPEMRLEPIKILVTHLIHYDTNHKLGFLTHI